MPLFCKDKGQWGSLVGVASHPGRGRSPSLYQISKSPRDHKGVFAKAALRESKYKGLSTRWCVWISSVSVGREACAPSLCLHLSPQQSSLQGTALPSPLWPPCGRGVAQHDRAKLTLRPSESTWNLQGLAALPNLNQTEQANQSWADPAHPNAVTWGSSAETCLYTTETSLVQAQTLPELLRATGANKRNA